MKKTVSKFGYHAQRGFSLLEIMIVLAIIGTIVGIVAVNMGGQADNANAQLADTQMRTIMAGIDRFRADAKRYPNNIDELALDRSKKPSDVKRFFGPYVNAEGLLDPWNNKYVLRKSGDSVELVSYGADGKAGGTEGDADIVVTK